MSEVPCKLLAYRVCEAIQLGAIPVVMGTEVPFPCLLHRPSEWDQIVPYCVPQATGFRRAPVQLKDLEKTLILLWGHRVYEALQLGAIPVVMGTEVTFLLTTPMARDRST